MVRVVATVDQAKLLSESNEDVEIVDAQGRRLGMILRPPSDEDVRIAKQRVDLAGKRHSTADVVSHLQSLEQE